MSDANTFFIQIEILRWGDAPIHSIAAALFLDKSRIHFFNDIGYKHGDFGHCPPERKVRKSGKCQCDPKTNFGNYRFYS